MLLAEEQAQECGLAGAVRSPHRPALAAPHGPIEPPQDPATVDEHVPRNPEERIAGGGVPRRGERGGAGSAGAFPPPRLHLGTRPGGDEPAPLEDGGPLDCGRDLLRPVGGEHERHALAGELGRGSEHQVARGGVEAVQELVEQQRPGARGERAGEQGAAGLARRDLQHGAAPEPLESDEAEGAAHEGLGLGGEGLGRPDAGREPAANHVLQPHSPVAPEVGVLRLGGHERDPSGGADGALGGLPFEVVQAPSAAGGVRPGVAAQEPQKRGLAGAIAAEDRPALALPERERDSREERSPPELHVDVV